MSFPWLFPSGFAATNGDYYAGFKAPSSLSANRMWELPAADGSANQVVKTNGSGVLSFGSVDWTEITSKPSTFPPSSHQHSGADITSGAVGLSVGGTGANLSGVSGIGSLITKGSSSALQVFGNPTEDYRFLFGKASNPVEWSGYKMPSSVALGDVLYASGTTTITTLAGNTAASKKFLAQTGTGSVSAAPVWSTIAASDITSGILDPARGGTGFGTTPVLGDVMISSAGDVWDRLPGNADSTKKFLASTGSGGSATAPVWSTLAAGDIPNLDASKITSGTLASTLGGTGHSTTAAGDLLYGATGNLWARLTAADGFLRRSGGNPHWHIITGWSEPTSFSVDRAPSGQDDLAALSNSFCTLVSDLRAAKILG